ncbi:MAG TPA: NYN domain-containing protein [Clostridia bacterium]|nr:NYN domain-containing protein [Clostridia bacterium]
MQPLTDLRLAVLIDADNVPYKSIKGIIEEIALYGTPTFKRIYGDWTKPNLAGWKSPLLENAITPIQQYGYTTGKNSTDSAMIIDAMDILYSGKVDGFCIVSSDSDFTRLAIRLREAGMKVLGIGERKTPNSLIVACDKFTYIEVINSLSLQANIEAVESVETVGSAGSAGSATGKSNTKNHKNDTPATVKISRNIIDLISISVTDLADENGWAFLGDVGNLIIKKQPDFDPRNFGYPKLTPLIKSLDNFEIDMRDTGQLNIKHIYIKIRKKS